jgi:hypothetical protein
MGKRAVCAGLAVIGVIYLVYPYATLYALQLSVQYGSPSLIAPFVAWDAVREGIKEDICDDAAVEAGSEPANAGAVLPAFGAGFVRQIKANIVDRAITPQSIGDMLRGADEQGGLKVNWAFFDGPQSFVVELAPGAEADQEPFKLRLKLEGGVWRITRAWLPRWMLERAAART